MFTNQTFSPGKTVLALCISAALTLVAMPASAMPILAISDLPVFYIDNGTRPENGVLGEAQITFDVYIEGGGYAGGPILPIAADVIYKIKNNAPPGAQMSITVVHWDDPDGIQSGPELFNWGGVDRPMDPTLTSATGLLFSNDPGASFPGGNTLAPSFDEDFSVSADPPPSSNGVNEGEMLAVRFHYSALNLLALSQGIDKIRLGFEVQGFENLFCANDPNPAACQASDSAQFWADMPAPPVGPTVVPEPSTYLLLGTGLLGLVGWRRRRNSA